jgi:thiol-disulfide isomerase/thioredoxin
MKMKGLNVKKLMKSVNAENVVIGVLVLVLVVLVVVYVKQNNEGFDAHKPELKFYMAPWCGFCTEAKEKVFDNFETMVDDDDKLVADKVTLVTINCDEEKEKCAAAGIQGYPTLVLNGNTFQGSASDKDAVNKFIEENK